MASIEIVLLMLVAVVISGYINRMIPFSLPLPVIQIALGGVIAAFTTHSLTLKPDVFFLLFLPPLLFLDGWRIPKDSLLRDKGTILQLALGLVIFTVLGAGYLIHWLIPVIPLAVAFALAAIVSPTDPVAVSSIAAKVPIPKQLMHILEGESLLNDASGLVCFQFAVAAALTGSFSLQQASTTFIWLVLAGLGSGVFITLAISIVQKRLIHRIGEEEGSQILVSLLIPFAAYIFAEQIHASGILAAVAAGISMSYVELTNRAMATTRLNRAAVWNTIQFALNGAMFVLLGEQLPNIVTCAIDTAQKSGLHHLWLLAVYPIGICLGLLLLRFVWVWASFQVRLLRQLRKGEVLSKPNWRLILAASLAGVKGAITLAGILTLPFFMPDGSEFPVRELTIYLATAVILLSMLLASVGLPILLKGLDTPIETVEQQAEDQARIAAANGAIKAIRQALVKIQQQISANEADLYANAASQVIAIYQQRFYEKEMGESKAYYLRKGDSIEHRLRLAGLQAEREVISELARKRRISDATSRRLVREIDLLEAIYSKSQERLDG